MTSLFLSSLNSASLFSSLSVLFTGFKRNQIRKEVWRIIGGPATLALERYRNVTPHYISKHESDPNVALALNIGHFCLLSGYVLYSLIVKSWVTLLVEVTLPWTPIVKRHVRNSPRNKRRITQYAHQTYARPILHRPRATRIFRPCARIPPSSPEQIRQPLLRSQCLE